MGASSARFHCAGSQGHSVYIRTGQTARHRSWSLAPVACAPLLASPAVKDAEQHPPEHWTTGPGHHDIEEERVGKKRWGRLIFSALMKNRDQRAGSGGATQDQPANFLFLFRLEGENPPTPVVFPHSAPRHSPSCVSLHGKICRVSHHSPTLSFFLFFFPQQKGKLKNNISFFFPNLELFRVDRKELLCLSPALKANFQLISSSKNIALQKETFTPSQKTMLQCSKAPKI